jgi:polysaccharide biosynthesis/export protein
LTAAYGKFFKEPTVLLNAKEINSRKVGITGSVHKSGEYALNEEMHIVQLITKAGGLQEYADKKNIRLVRRHPDGTVETIIFNYNKLFEGRGVDHLPLLRPVDQVVVNER